MGKKNIVIVGFGEEPAEVLLKSILEEADTVVAADGGADTCMKVGKIPDFVVGDMDSAKETGSAEIVKQTDESSTDMEKALDFALLLNPKKIVITAAFGKRKDHAFSNLLIFRKYAEEVKLEIIDDYGELQILLPGKYDFSATPGKTVSMFSIEPLKDFSLKGFRYNLKKHDTTSLFYGQSNVFQEKKCCIEFSSGALYVYEVYE